MVLMSSFTVTLYLSLLAVVELCIVIIMLNVHKQRFCKQSERIFRSSANVFCSVV